MKRYKMASVSGLRWYKAPRPQDENGGLRIMGDNGEIVAYMPIVFNVRAHDEIRNCLLDVDADGALVINGWKDGLFHVKMPDFYGDHQEQPQVHGLFEVTPDEERHIAGLTVYAESAYDLPVLGKILGGLDDWAIAHGGY